MCQILEGKFIETLETNQIGWFLRDAAMSPLCQGDLAMAEAEQLFQYQRYPNLPTEFD